MYAHPSIRKSTIRSIQSGPFSTHDVTIGDILGAVSKEGLTDDRVAMARIDPSSGRVEFVLITGEAARGQSRIPIALSRHEFASVIPVNGIRFFESPTLDILDGRLKATTALDALVKLRTRDATPTKGLVLATSAGRTIHQQFMQSDNGIERIDGITSIRHDNRGRALYGIRLREGLGTEIVMLSGNDINDPRMVRDVRRWTKVTDAKLDAKDSTLVSLSKLRSKVGLVDMVVNLRNSNCRRLTIENRNGVPSAVWSPVVVAESSILGAFQGREPYVITFQTYRGGIAFAFVYSDNRSHLGPYAS